MDHKLEIAYVGIEVPDPMSVSSFFGDVIGLAPGEPGPGGAITWRNDSKARRVIIEPGPAGDAVYVGFEAIGDNAFEDAAARLEKAGFPVVEGGNDRCRDRRVRRLIHTMAPWGVCVELSSGLEDAQVAFSSKLMPSGFSTNDMGFGHVVFVTTMFDESRRFLTEGLGMAQSDWIETELAEGVDLEVHFYHCNSRHHSVALAQVPFDLPKKLHHLMVEANSRDDVGAAFDRAWEAGLGLPMGLGLHDNDRTFSFYVASPAGFAVEVGFGARIITCDWNDNRRYDRASVWGHQTLR
jgi:2,3-dihydroxybiphenyl 1,2-dioxygenase